MPSALKKPPERTPAGGKRIVARTSTAAYGKRANKAAGAPGRDCFAAKKVVPADRHSIAVDCKDSISWTFKRRCLAKTGGAGVRQASRTEERTAAGSMQCCRSARLIGYDGHIEQL